MSDILLNAEGDLDGSFSLTSSAQQLIRQQVLITLRTNYEEWKFDLDRGLPWITANFDSRQIFEKGSKSFSDAAIRAIVLRVKGVEDVISLSSSIDSVRREYSLDMKLKIYDGSIIELKESVEV